jgi:cobalt-zinc-cadmium efflux system protein
MLEDVLGWAAVLLGAVIMRFADISIIDPLLSIGVTLYISIHAVMNLNQICDVLLMKSPRGIEPERIRCHLMELEGITDVHHLHIWTIDQVNNYATVHVVTDGDQIAAKKAVKKELAELGIAHCTVELESLGEIYEDKECRTCAAGVVRHSHHSHNHRHCH